MIEAHYLLYVQNPTPFTDVVYEVKNSKAAYNVKASCNDFPGKLGLIKNDADHEN